MPNRPRWRAQILAVLCYSLSNFALAQSLQGRAPRVDESRATAALAGDMIEVRLPLAAPAELTATTKAWVLSPAGEKGTVVTESVAAGTKTILLSIPRPRDKKGKLLEDVEWYRVGYSIESPSAPAAHGILALGAITTNLFHLSLAGPSGDLTPGRPLSVRVFAGNPVTRSAVHGVQITAQLELDVPGQKVPQKITRNAAVDDSSEALFTFPIPDVTGVSASLHLTGTLRGAGGESATSTLDSDFEALTQAFISLEKDKALYRPGQTVHMRALVFDGRSHAAARAPLTLTINDPDGKKVLAQALTTNSFGIAAFDWKLSPQTETGTYTVKVEPANDSVLDGTGYISVRIEQYDLPEFTVSAKLDRGYYLEGQTPAVRIHAEYLFGKPVAGGVARLVRNPNAESVSLGAAKSVPSESERSALDSNGDAVFHPDLSAAFRTFHDSKYLRYLDLTFRAYVTDTTTGRSEPRKFSVRITHQPIHIYLRELGGNNREGDYLVITSYADGMPAACKVTLDSVLKGALPVRIAMVQTNRYGLGKVHLRYSQVKNGYPSIDLRITAEDSKGALGKFDDDVNSYDQRDTLWIEVAKSLLAPAEPIRATVNGPSGELVDVDVIGAGAILEHRQMVLNDGHATVVLPADDRFHGLIHLVAYSMRDPASEEYGVLANKSVLYPEDTELRLQLLGLKQTYTPGGKVNATLRATDPKGAVSAAIGVGVTDTAVDERARTEEDFEQGSWGWGAWYQESQSIGGVTFDDLNQADMSKPVSHDLQLAAEALLAESYGSNISIQSEDDSNDRNEYESSMTKTLKPLGVALLKTKPGHLTADLNKIHEVVSRTKLGSGILVDPWDVPYRAKMSTQGNEEVLDLVSAGPDKKIGTADDFTIEVARQNVFARTGERLQAMLQSAMDRGEKLPGSVSALIAFAQGRGLNLAAVHDPKGRQFVYHVHVERKWLSVSVRMQRDGVSPNASQEYSFEPPVWASPMFNYFAPQSRKLQRALRQWLAARHTFPVTDKEALRAFSAAGISFNSLSDPTGEHFSIKTEEVLSYTQVQAIHAGKSIAVTTKPITVKMHAIEVLRSPTERKSKTPEIVDEFVEPYLQQSGADLLPKEMESGTFRTGTGAVGGTVTDQSGAVIAGAMIVAKSAKDKEIRAQSDATGRYIVGNLEPGFYSVAVSAPGFMVMSLRGVEVSSAAMTTVDVTLHVGTVAEMVQVSAAPPPAVATASVTVSAGVVANDRNPAASRTFRTPAGSATVIQPGITPRLRHVFEETAYWAPLLETDASGRAALDFTMPDSLTTWKLHALASTVDGRVQELDTQFTTFQPFFIDLDAPQVLTAGDELTLPVNLRNYTKNAVTLPASISDEPWMQTTTSRVAQVTVPADGSAAVHFGLRAAHMIDDGHLRISAADSTLGDAVEKTIRVHPDGEPRILAAAALLHNGQNLLRLDLPGSAISGSLHARLRIYPNLATHIAESMGALIAQPHGCAEQIISSAYPSIFLLGLVKQTGRRSPFSERAQKYLQQGYENLLDDYDANGGLTYWGGSDHTPDAALTAYSLEFLDDAARFISVRQPTIAAARGWLLSTQQADGSWKPRYGKPDPRLTLYVALQLMRSLPADAPGPQRERTRMAVDRALTWVRTFVTEVHDPYSNAIRLQIAVLRKRPAEQEQLTTELINTVRRDRTGAFWQVHDALPFYTWGYAGSIETSALVAHALLATNLTASQRTVVDSVLQHLVESEDASGIWYSGHTTVRVLQTLLPFAEEQLKSAQSNSPLAVWINGVPLRQSDEVALQEDPGLVDAPRMLNVTGYLKPGANQLRFSSGSGSLFASAQLSTTLYVPWQTQPNPGIKTGARYGLDFHYHCQTSGAVLGKPVSCEVQERRFGAAGYGMLLAEIGLPPGAEVDREQLARLEAEGSIDRYEITPDHVVFYTWSGNPAGIHFSFQFTPRFEIHAKAAPSILYDYYNPDERVVLAPEIFDVPQRSE